MPVETAHLLSTIHLILTMKNTSSFFSKLVAVAACTLTLASCSRSEYAMLPKGPSYYGSTRASASVAAVTPTPAAQAPTALQPVAEVSQPVAAAKVQLAPNASAVSVALASSVATHAQSGSAPKMSLVQRVALSKVVRKIEKVASKSTAYARHGDTAATQKLEGRLRQGIILVVLGLVIEILAAAISSYLVYLLGAILILVGGVLIVLYLLDSL